MTEPFATCIGIDLEWMLVNCAMTPRTRDRGPVVAAVVFRHGPGPVPV